MTDEILIKLCIEGDRRGQSFLYQKFVSSMGRLCLRYLKNEEDAKEILTDGFMKVFKGISKFKSINNYSLEAWIRKIMVNECLMKIRRKRIIFEDINDLEIGDTTAAELDHSGEEIFRAILSLPDGYRSIFNLYVIDGFSHQEISSLLSISESNSRSQLSHARQKLQQLLKNSHEV